MKRAVHKYEIGYGAAVAEIPPKAKLLHVAVQRVTPNKEAVFVWAEVDPDEGMQPRGIAYFATGELLPIDAEYVGTAPTPDGAFVWHVYQKRGD